MRIFRFKRTSVYSKSLYPYNHRSILNEGSRGQGFKDSSEGFQAILGRENRKLYILTMHNDVFSIKMDSFHPLTP